MRRTLLPRGFKLTPLSASPRLISPDHGFSKARGSRAILTSLNALLRDAAYVISISAAGP